MPETAVVLNKRGSLSITDFARPELGPDDGLLRVEVAGICKTDVDIVSGAFDTPLPLIMGHEIMGVIDEIGERAAERWNVARGDRVVVEPMAGCGSCRYCTAGAVRFCSTVVGYGTTISSQRAPHLFGAYATSMYLSPGSIVHKVPGSMSSEVAMLCTVAISNGVRWTLGQGGVVQGDDVVVQGVGPIGLSCLAAARSAGARRVIAVGLARDELGFSLAPRFGADLVVAADRENVEEVVRHETRGQRADVVVDTTGSPQSLATSLRLVRPMGTVVSGGVTGKDTVTSLHMDQVTLNEIRLQGVFTFDTNSVRRAIALAESDRFPFDELVTHRFKLRDVQKAIDKVADVKATDRLKVVLDLTQGVD